MLSDKAAPATAIRCKLLSELVIGALLVRENSVAGKDVPAIQSGSTRVMGMHSQGLVEAGILRIIVLAPDPLLWSFYRHTCIHPRKTRCAGFSTKCSAISARPISNT